MSEDAEGRLGPVILFDGVCNLCNAAVRWVVERDTGRVFRFASLQSQAAHRLLQGRDALPGEALPDSIVLVDEAGVHVRSDAALRMARRLGLPWSLLSAAVVVPRPLRDAVYEWVARNRYRWFGRRETCALPTPETAALFLDVGEDLPAVAPPGAPRSWSSAGRTKGRS